MCKSVEDYANRKAAEARVEAEKQAEIKVTIETSVELGVAKEKTISLLMRKCNLTEQDANEQYEKYVGILV